MNIVCFCELPKRSFAPAGIRQTRTETNVMQIQCSLSSRVLNGIYVGFYARYAHTVLPAIQSWYRVVQAKRSPKLPWRKRNSPVLAKRNLNWWMGGGRTSLPRAAELRSMDLPCILPLPFHHRCLHESSVRQNNNWSVSIKNQPKCDKY
jgi:hypothetical protein